MTPTRLVIAHADDHDEHDVDEAVATATTETRPAGGGPRRHAHPRGRRTPTPTCPGTLGREITLTLGWGAVSRLDLVPATCGDPDVRRRPRLRGHRRLRRHLPADQRRRRRRRRALAAAMSFARDPVRGDRPAELASARRTTCGHRRRRPRARSCPRSLACLGSSRYAGRAAASDLAPARRAVVVLVDGAGPRPAGAPPPRARAVPAHRARHGIPAHLRLPLDDRHLDGRPSAPACRRGRTAWSGSRCSCPRPTGSSTSCPGRTDRTPGCGSRTRRSSRQAEADGVAVTRIGPGYFDGSGLTQAALRGGAVRAGARARGRRRRVALAAVRGSPALARLPLLGRPGQDRARPRLPLLAVGLTSWSGSTASWPGWCASVPSDTAVYVTADHGMVDVPVRAADRPGPRAGAAGRRPPRRRRGPLGAAVLRAGSAVGDVAATLAGPRRQLGDGDAPASRRSTRAGSARSETSSPRGSATSSSTAPLTWPSWTRCGCVQCCFPCSVCTGP